jgi:acyl carrier protein
MTIVEKLNKIFCEIFEDEELVISPEMTADDVDGWDSLSHVKDIERKLAD